MESTNRTVDMVVRLTGGASTIVRGRRKDIRSIRKNSPEVRSGAARSPDGSLSNCSGTQRKRSGTARLRRWPKAAGCKSWAVDRRYPIHELRFCEDEAVLSRQELKRLHEQVPGGFQFFRHLLRRYPMLSGRAIRRIRFEVDDHQPPASPQ